MDTSSGTRSGDIRHGDGGGLGRALRVRVPAAVLASLICAALPLSAQRADQDPCRAPEAAPDFVAVSLEGFPGSISPAESVRVHDSVFHAEVAVPVRRCSLGWCAGLRVLGQIKGSPARTELVRVAGPLESPACPPPLFRDRSKRWVVFANQGTSKGGQKYLQIETDGPSFASATLPNFNRLERRFQSLRAGLDEAINARLGRR